MCLYFNLFLKMETQIKNFNLGLLAPTYSKDSKIVAFSGRRGSGKTVSALYIAKRLHETNIIQVIFYVSGTKLDQRYEKLIRQDCRFTPSNNNKSYSECLISAINMIEKYNKKQPLHKILLICDDPDMSEKNNERLYNLAQDSRHLNLYLFMIVHGVVNLNPKIRKLLNFVFIHHIIGNIEITNLSNNYAPINLTARQARDFFVRTIDEICQNYQSLVINFDKNDNHGEYFYKFKPLIN